MAASSPSRGGRAAATGGHDSGSQGSIARNGVIEDRDLLPGGEPYEDASTEEILAAYLYPYSPEAYACGYVGLRLTDARAVTGPADIWLRLPAGDHWC